jgi:hypothetical protein
MHGPLNVKLFQEDCLSRTMEAPKSFENLVKLQSTPRSISSKEGRLPQQVTRPLSWYMNIFALQSKFCWIIFACCYIQGIKSNVYDITQFLISCHRGNTCLFSFFVAQQLLVGQDFLIIEDSRSHSDTQHTTLLSGQVISPVPRPLSDNTQHPQETRHRCPSRNSNLQSQQASGRRPKP